MTLALLIMAVGGAWAEETPLLTIESKDYTSFTSGSKTFDDKVTITFSNSVTNTGNTDGWYAAGGSLLTVAGINGYTITSCKFYTNYGTAATGYTVEGESPSVYLSQGQVYTDDSKSVYIAYIGITKIEVFGTAGPTEWELKPDDTGKKWILADMPASDIELQVEYFAESNLFLSKDALADKGSISVKAGDLGLQFGDDGKSANTVTEGTEMTVTYNGTKKLLGMKVEKKAAEPADKGHALSASAVGEIVGSDGKAYAVADKDNLPSGVTAVAMVAYKSGSNGLAIQLNSNPEKMKWAQAKTYAEGLTAVSGGTWRLPSKADWQNMFVGCAVSGDASASDDMNPIAGFKAKIAAAGITWLSDDYWTSTEGDSMAWMVGVNLDDSNAKASFGQIPSDFAALNVRACLAF